MYELYDTLTDRFLQTRAYSPTRSRWGPTSTEFQFHETGEGQLVKPSQCLLVNIMYL